MGEKFNAPDPGAMQPTTTGEAGERSAYMKMQHPDAARSVGIPSTSDVSGAGPDAASRSFEKHRNDNPQADDAKSSDPWVKLEHAKSDPESGPDAARPKTSYDVKNEKRI